MEVRSLFGLSEHLGRLSKAENPLKVLDATVDFEYFRGWLVEGLGYGDGAKGWRPPFDPVFSICAAVDIVDLLAECITNLMSSVNDSVASSVRPIAKSTTDILGAAADMTVAKIVAGGVEIGLRAGAVRVAGSEGQRDAKQEDARQFHDNVSFSSNFGRLFL